MFEGEKIRLRGLELTDVPELMKYWNSREVKKFLMQSAPHSFQEEEEWVRNTWENRKKGSSYVFGIILKENDLYIGNVEIIISNTISRRGTLGVVIFNTNYWDKGLGTEAINLVLEFGFSSLNLHSIELEVFENNLRAQKSYEKCGFKQYGKRRQSIFFEGKFIDMLLFDMLKNEWIEKKSN
ncbi:MAG: GNAT family N-acetyltransferase [Candidatus Hodarchaeales archaeon]|jgi:RimJ/RimL family protein N-acetyltransferase